MNNLIVLIKNYLHKLKTCLDPADSSPAISHSRYSYTNHNPLLLNH